MNIKYLQQFMELIRCTSMSQYASRANVTHPQVSGMVMELERELGYQLLIRDRTKSNIKLTKKGEILVKRIPYVFNEIANLRAHINSDEELKLGNFDLFTTTYLADYWISPHLAQFKKDYPNLTLNLFAHEKTPKHHEKASIFTISPQTEGDDNIHQTFLLDFHVGLWASKEYIKNFGMPESVSDLLHHRIICFDRKWDDRAYPTVNWYMNHTNFQLRQENVIVISSSVGMMKAAEAGLGIFSLSEESIKSVGMRFERILPELMGPAIPMCLSYEASWQGHKSVQSIEDFLIDIFRRHKY